MSHHAMQTFEIGFSLEIHTLQTEHAVELRF